MFNVLKVMTVWGPDAVQAHHKRGGNLPTIPPIITYVNRIKQTSSASSNARNRSYPVVRG